MFRLSVRGLCVMLGDTRVGCIRGMSFSDGSSHWPQERNVWWLEEKNTYVPLEIRLWILIDHVIINFLASNE